MDIVNGTKLDLQATQGLDKEGKPWLIVIAKGTYRFEPDDTGRPQLAPKQNKLMATDLFEAEPGLSTPFFESDYVPKKLACDVIVKGSAHAPHGKPVRTMEIGMRVIDTRQRTLLQKVIHVTGPRVWQKKMLGVWGLSDAGYFTSMPITYSRAFGGLLTHEAIGSDNPNDFIAHPMNLVGRGYAKGKFLKLLDGAPAHNLEQIKDGSIQRITDPEQLGLPASLGPLARNWQPRLKFAGTYDEQWKAEVFPLLPADFDERYYQCAPPDQQMPFPQGGETVVLANLSQAAALGFESSRGLTQFTLPRLNLPMVVLGKSRSQQLVKPVVDTIAIDADAQTYDITWRASVPLQRSLHEVHTIAAGSVCKRWWKSRIYGTDDCGCGGLETDDEDLAPVDEALDA